MKEFLTLFFIFFIFSTVLLNSACAEVYKPYYPNSNTYYQKYGKARVVEERHSNAYQKYYGNYSQPYERKTYIPPNPYRNWRDYARRNKY